MVHEAVPAGTTNERPGTRPSVTIGIICSQVLKLRRPGPIGLYMASATQPRFGRDPIEAMGKSKVAAAALVEHLASPAGEFDLMASMSDPNQIEPLDLVRLSMLGKPVAPHSARWLLSDDGQWLAAEKLAAIPLDLQLGSPHPHAAFACSDLMGLL